MSGIIGMIGWFDPENDRGYSASPFKVVDANAAWIAVIFYDGGGEWSDVHFLDAKEFIQLDTHLRSRDSVAIAVLLSREDEWIAAGQANALKEARS